MPGRPLFEGLRRTEKRIMTPVQYRERVTVPRGVRRVAALARRVAALARRARHRKESVRLPGYTTAATGRHALHRILPRAANPGRCRPASTVRQGVDRRGLGVGRRATIADSAVVPGQK